MSETTTSSPSVRDNYSEAQWNQLATAPIRVAAAMTFADKTGPRAMLNEMSAGAQAFAAGAKQFTESALVPALGTSLNQGMFEGMQPQKGQSADQVASTFRMEALDNIGQALTLIKEKGTAADLDAYQKWVLAIATIVMTEAKSGSTLGIGGERVSSGEDAFFQELKTALGVTE